MKVFSSIKEVLAPIKKNSTIFIHGAAATPQVLLEGICHEYADLENLEFVHLHTEGECEYAKPQYKNFRITNLFTDRNIRGRIDHDRIDYLPCFLSEIPNLFRSGAKKVDVALIQVSPPDKHGHVSLGVSVDTAKAAVECASLVIAQINPKMPRVHGSGFIHVDDIDYAIEYESELPSPRQHHLSDIEMQIGAHVASLVEDGATIQLGIGSIPDAVARNLKHHKHLGLHTEMWSNGAFELIKSGVIDNSKKTFHQGISTSSFIVGSREVYDYIDDNMQTLNFEADYTNSPGCASLNFKLKARSRSGDHTLAYSSRRNRVWACKSLWACTQ